MCVYYITSTNVHANVIIEKEETATAVRTIDHTME